MTLMTGPVTGRFYPEFARDLAAKAGKGRLLDVGSGPGRMLQEVHRIAPGLVLFGLDVSPAMIDLARRNLDGVPVDLRLGSIAHTDFDAGFFDAVTCMKSFYMWDEPAACLAEVHRILKPGGSAYLYESTRDFDPAALAALRKEGLKAESPLRRVLIALALKKQLRETYSNAEILAIAEKTPFRGACLIEPMPVLPPIWIRVTLTRMA